MLAAETQMFDKYNKRVEPLTKEGAHGGLHPPSNLNITPSHSTHDLGGGRVGRRKSRGGSRSSTTDRTLKLTAEQKCDIAQREIEEFREEIDKLRDESEKVLDNFKVGAVAWILCFLFFVFGSCPWLKFWQPK